ncbi:MAG: hypothetical protein Q605_AUC00210G0002, partial [Actinomyces urogenitalis DORA_12]
PVRGNVTQQASVVSMIARTISPREGVRERVHVTTPFLLSGSLRQLTTRYPRLVRLGEGHYPATAPAVAPGLSHRPGRANA